jgi:NhaA family Na+:H+ antiporter
MSIRHWINDALMAVFFFAAGLEIKREMVAGELSSVRKSALPVMAAIGGMLLPACIYALFNGGSPETSGGWGIPMATDIAFAVGVLSLLGDRVPAGVKIFLMTLAVVDDIGAIIVLALFYPVHPVEWGYMLAAVALALVLVVLNVRNVRRKPVYIILGTVLWYLIYMSGIHATVSGVVLAMVMPSRIRVKGAEGTVETKVDCSLEERIKPLVTFLIVPLFALANAGVAFNPEVFSDGLPGVSLGIAAGLLTGIFLFSLLSVKGRLAALPSGVEWKHIAAVGVIGGIGFTMSIFINSLSFTDPAVTDIGKISVLITSVIAMAAGLAAMAAVCGKDNKPIKIKVQ